MRVLAPAQGGCRGGEVVEATRRRGRRARTHARTGWVNGRARWWGRRKGEGAQGRVRVRHTHVVAGQGEGRGQRVGRAREKRGGVCACGARMWLQGEVQRGGRAKAKAARA